VKTLQACRRGLPIRGACARCRRIEDGEALIARHGYIGMSAK